MKTEDLIKVMVADGAVPPMPYGVRFAATLAGGIAVASIVFVLAMGIRPDVAKALGTDRFVFKVVYVAVLFAASLWLAERIGRPGVTLAHAAKAVGAVFGLLAVAVILELTEIPVEGWGAAMVGTNWKVCLAAIPLLSIAPLIAGLLALRQGAPLNARAAGAAAGLLAGSAGAVLYGWHCDNDSPLFVAVWYGLTIATVTTIGALVGPRLLRW